MKTAMKKRDWAFMALCLTGAILAGVGSVKFAMDYNVIHSVVLESEAPESPAAAKLAVVHQGFMTGYERAAVRSE
jgi:hypothetical protein